MAASDALLTVRDIHTYYGDSYVLHGLSLELQAGRIVVILGRGLHEEGAASLVEQRGGARKLAAREVQEGAVLSVGQGVHGQVAQPQPVAHQQDGTLKAAVEGLAAKPMLVVGDRHRSSQVRLPLPRGPATMSTSSVAIARSKVICHMRAQRSAWG